MIRLLFLLQACPAEQLGVEVPAGGVERISAEDLQRDVYALTRPDVDAGAVFAKRMGQMHLSAELTGDGRVCARREGAGPARVVVAPWTPGDIPAMTQAAVLISVAKGWDGQAPPKRTTWLCLATADAALPEGERIPLTVTVVADRIEAIDYRVVREATVAWFAALDS